MHAELATVAAPEKDLVRFDLEVGVLGGEFGGIGVDIDKISENKAK